tara:strand:+ start:585 stop:794 length:210 start_codon:yes stop_codon:yes gene_type:complete
MKRIPATRVSRRGRRLNELNAPVVEEAEEPVVEEPVVEVPKPKPKRKPRKKKTSKAKKSEEDGGTEKTI